MYRDYKHKEPVTGVSLLRRVAESGGGRGGATRLQRIDLNTPFTAIRTAYMVLETLESQTGPPEVKHLTAIALIGIAVRAIALMAPCELCFRWAIPGYRHCHEHTRSNLGFGTASERAVRQRKAVRNMTEFRTEVGRLALKSTEISAQDLPLILGRLLWNLPAVDEKGLLRAVGKAIKASQYAKLQSREMRNRRSQETYALLRREIDPYEWLPTRWSDKIEALDVWLRVTDQHRGAGQEMRWRLLKALELARMGLPRSAVARQLDVHPSTISNWVKRYENESHPFAGLLKQIVRAFDEPTDQARRFQRVVRVMERTKRTAEKNECSDQHAHWA